MEVKTCKKCGEEKSLESFGIAKQHKDGLKSQCKTCEAIYKKQYRKDNLERLVTYKKQWREANLEKVARSQKQWNKANREKLKGYREANPEYRKQYRKDNAEKQAEYIKQYQKDNPERCRLITQRRRAREKYLLSDFTVEQWETCLLYFDYKDAYTGLPLNSPSQDHVVPLSKGGCYTANNIVPCNRSINSSKKDRNMLTWFRKQTYYDAEREKKILTYLHEVASEFNTRKRQGVKSNE